MGNTRLLAAGGALAATMAVAVPVVTLDRAVAVPAPARGPASGMEFSAPHDEVEAGTPIVLSGRAGYLNRATGNGGRVDIFFRKEQTAPKVYLGSVTAGSSGKFRFPTRANATGEYVAHYQHRKLAITADATDFLAVFTSRQVDRRLFSWTATNLSCLPTCKAVGPDQLISAGPVKVKLERKCLQPKSGGRIGFTADQKNAYRAGDLGWRDFPEGDGPTEFELKPTTVKGHFYLEWTSATPPQGQFSSCDISFAVSQTSTDKNYV
ncbi:hypothetical protein FHR83_007277 [Actinoplanes campanulatus]|uniref:Uncharacterized protein n=1 Tax=Actinoplanes campanulatus TaxID=113559 RepID=A0A7W5ANV3_9ACTN|nr:hypothetical protein [Actinoplanes campanulatus]MBB3099570.1 hypothetical protein [Actinoplanes campanulatus]GGN42182.1 hypothetical protein GCM10010109_73090 [Actinoplanes campanulatus]GID39920.1 hypothetical protein Aca09nite_64260 [Actinoplanes campanulatus]